MGNTFTPAEQDDIQAFKNAKLAKKSFFGKKENANEPQQDLIEMAEKIYSNYLKGKESIFEVNIDRKTCEEVKQKILDGNVDITLFDNVYQAVKMNLIDTYSRFEYSSIYKQYLQAKEKQNELAKSVGL